mmetsp:Transcript_47400/g.74081  ORF Transcript_47400/g.74081 Transcript_47400/m.74081 type:complete len:112 (-) Transcript_47400:186-521(-)
MATSYSTTVMNRERKRACQRGRGAGDTEQSQSKFQIMGKGCKISIGAHGELCSVVTRRLKCLIPKGQMKRGEGENMHQRDGFKVQRRSKRNRLAFLGLKVLTFIRRMNMRL